MVGCPGMNAWEAHRMCAEVTAEMPVLCCAGPNEKVWTSDSSACRANLMYEQAEAHCAASGQRLCSAEELLTDLQCKTGCEFDYDRVWTATPCSEGLARRDFGARVVEGYAQRGVVPRGAGAGPRSFALDPRAAGAGVFLGGFAALGALGAAIWAAGRRGASERALQRELAVQRFSVSAAGLSCAPGAEEAPTGLSSQGVASRATVAGRGARRLEAQSSLDACLFTAVPIHDVEAR